MNKPLRTLYFRLAVISVLFVVGMFLAGRDIARGEEPTSEQICHQIGRISLDNCIIAAKPTVLPGPSFEANKEFAIKVCVESGVWAENACNNGNTQKYEGQDPCEGAALFAHDAIIEGGKVVVAKEDEAARGVQTLKVEGWAGSAGMRMLRICKTVQAQEEKKAGVVKI